MLKVPFLDRHQLRGSLLTGKLNMLLISWAWASWICMEGLCELQKEEQYHWVRQQVEKGLYWPAWASHPGTWLTVVAMQQIRKLLIAFRAIYHQLIVAWDCCYHCCCWCGLLLVVLPFYCYHRCWLVAWDLTPPKHLIPSAINSTLAKN